jgi:hypothetical protein
MIRIIVREPAGNNLAASRTLLRSMTANRQPPPPLGPVGHADAAQAAPAPGRVLLVAVLIIVGSAVLGLIGGLVWAAVAPRVVYQVYTLNPPTAYAINPETSAFIAADGTYTFIGLGGGAVIGVLAYVFGVRRYGPVPMVAAVIGATAAAFLADWTGNHASGASGFDAVLASSKPGVLLRAPITLGSHGAIAFWPMAAAAVAGGLELISVLRARQLDFGVPAPPSYAAAMGMPPYAAEAVGSQPPHPGGAPGSQPPAGGAPGSQSPSPGGAPGSQPPEQAPG